MFKSITYEVTFPTGPRPHFKGDWSFNKGFTAIIGPNEAGKSMILEFLRFSIFGSAALRGPTTDYKTLKVRTELTLKDQDLVVERSITNAKIVRDGETVCVGTKPVNQWFLKELGFGLDVFDVANNMKQGDIERLGDMRPSERQKLVDGTVGLDKIDALVKHCSDTALGFEREAAALERTLVEPVRPSEPECWPNRGIMQDFLQQAEKDAVELAGVEGELRAPRLPAPQEPTCDVKESEGELQVAIAAETRLGNLEAEKRHLPPVIDVADCLAKIEAYEAYVGAQRFLQANPAPPYGHEHLEQWKKDWSYKALWRDYMAYRAEKDRLQHLIEHADKVTCPECSHAFPLDEKAVVEAQAAWEKLTWDGDVPIAAEPSAPPLSAAQIDKMLAGWDNTLLERRAAAEAVPQAPAPDIWCRREELPRFEAANARWPLLEAEIAEATADLIVDARPKLARLKQYELEVSYFETRVNDYNKQQERIAKLEARKAEIAYAPARVAELRPIVAAFAPYERDLARYEADLKVYSERMAQISDLNAKAQAWRSARDALGKLRGLIKLHLYPSLAAAASYFLTGMTGGVRNKIEISEGFEITVDGQGLDTLSGSGKAVANLAIRLGLGRVLTHSVFPVVLADEIDASMDDDRAERTADILHQCARRLSQLLLVSHKTPEAEFYLNLGETSEQPATT